MKKTIKYRIFRWRANRYFSRYPRAKKYVDYEHARRILLLYESRPDNQDETIRLITEKLVAANKLVTTCVYAAGESKPVTSQPDMFILCKKDINLTGKPVQAFKALEQQQFDLAIDLTTSPCLPLLYILLYANAACKAGLQHTDIPLLDFIISYPKVKQEPEMEKQIDVNNLYEHILFYLKNIRSND